MSITSINLKNVKFSYKKDKTLVLSDISVDIEDGTVNVLLGLNGCGKTTLIKLLAGIYKTNDGNISYNDTSINKINIKERSVLLSYVPQKITSIDDIIISDYLTYGMLNSLRFYQAPTVNHKNKAILISRRLGIEHLINKKMGEVSGGERQIVCLCAALLQDTNVILLDEPTSALDLKNQNIVLSILKQVAKEENKTIILSSHNPNHALFLDCKVAILNKGKLIKYGDAKDIINIENLKNIYGDKTCLSKDLAYNEISFST